MSDKAHSAPDKEPVGLKEKLAEGTLISHLVELRTRLVRATIAIGVIFIVLVPFSAEIFEFISRPVVVYFFIY